MDREWVPQYSGWLNREMHMLVYGWTGTPVIAFPCQDGMCNNWEGYQMTDTLADFIEEGHIQLFVVDTVDQESWSDLNGDPWHRAEMQDRYYHYIVDEAVPLVNEINGTGIMPLVTGFSLGATHAVIAFFRRPDLFGGVIALSGCYDTDYFWHGWCNETLYENAPLRFLRNMPEDHPYVSLYNERRIAICVGQGAWEDEGRRTTAMLRDILESKGVSAWIDFWGYDVEHDWPWWRKEIRYFLPWALHETD